LERELQRTRQLIDAARAGAREAYDELLRLHRAFLERQLHGRLPAALKGRVEASDVIQEALIDAVRHFDRFEYRGRGSFGRWLARILDNRARMTIEFHLRARKRSALREVALERSGLASTAPSRTAPATSATSPPSAAAKREANQRIARGLALLPADHAEVIRRIKHDGQSLAEAAQAMHRSQGATKKLLARALVGLRHVLREGERGSRS
jgi:RNA polymerase sigma-70 factor (ECF subfamily)